MHNGLIWMHWLDRRYLATVTRTGPHMGELVISDDDQPIHRRSVQLSDFLYGPTVGEVAVWLDIITDIVYD
jgi:hypothetical protein